MATKQETTNQSKSDEGIFEAVRRAGTEAIEAYESQAKQTIELGEDLVKDVPLVRVVAGAQADVARAAVDIQTWTARQLIGA